jgi:hypothetical protein
MQDYESICEKACPLYDNYQAIYDYFFKEFDGDCTIPYKSNAIVCNDFCGSGFHLTMNTYFPGQRLCTVRGCNGDAFFACEDIVVTADDPQESICKSRSCDKEYFDVISALNQKYPQCQRQLPTTKCNGNCPPFSRLCPDFCGTGTMLTVYPTRCALTGCNNNDGTLVECEKDIRSGSLDQICEQYCLDQEPIIPQEDEPDIAATNQNSEASCDLNPGCSALGMLGSCCPSADGVFLNCCEREFAQYQVHPACSHLTNDCCPTETGVFLDCCSEDASLDNITFPQQPELAQCSNFPKCANLAGKSKTRAMRLHRKSMLLKPETNPLMLGSDDCCPTRDGIYLYCCERIDSQCQSHPGCATLWLQNECCPTVDGVYLNCCERPFAQAAAHEKCKDLDGNACPGPDGSFANCCQEDQLAATIQYEAAIQKESLAISIQHNLFPSVVMTTFAVALTLFV